MKMEEKNLYSSQPGKRITGDYLNFIVITLFVGIFFVESNSKCKITQNFCRTRILVC